MIGRYVGREDEDNSKFFGGRFCKAEYDRFEAFGEQQYNTAAAI